MGGLLFVKFNYYNLGHLFLRNLGIVRSATKNQSRILVPDFTYFIEVKVIFYKKENFNFFP